MTLLASLAQAALLGATAYVLARGWASLMTHLADAGCTCAKGKVCAKCLASSEAIRPKPGSAT